MTVNDNVHVCYCFDVVNMKALVSVAKFKKLLHTPSGGKTRSSPLPLGNQTIAVQTVNLAVH